MTRWLLMVVAGGWLAGGWAADAAAQACLGLPTLAGEYAFGLNGELAPSYRGYGFALHANTPISLLASASYQRDEVDEPGSVERARGHTVGARLGWELPVPNTSICPVVGVSYSVRDFELVAAEGAPAVHLEAIAIPLLIGIGQRFDVDDDVFLVPAARAGLVHVRQRRDVEGAGTADLNSIEVLVGADLSVSVGPVYVGGGLRMMTESRPEPHFLIVTGVILR